jgi:hypothetical protein
MTLKNEHQDDLQRLEEENKSLQDEMNLELQESREQLMKTEGLLLAEKTSVAHLREELLELKDKNYGQGTLVQQIQGESGSKSGIIS